MLSRDKFEFYVRAEEIHDKKLETKPVGYFKDAIMRFSRNKSSVAAAVIILGLLCFAVFVPVFLSNSYTNSPTDTTYLQYSKLLPKSKLFAWAGWDGCTNETLSVGDYYSKDAIGVETGMNPIVRINNINGSYYDVKIDSYLRNGMIYMTATEAEYRTIQNWQDENGIQVIYPAVDTSSFSTAALKNNANIWYECTSKGVPKPDKDGNYVHLYKTTGNDGNYNSLRIRGDDGSFKYAAVTGTSTAVSYRIRVFTYTYFQYRYGFEPSFLFGTNAYGQDIITRLAKAARFSFILAISVSLINLVIGALYGAIEGYYGGVIDLVMERISDVLGGVPFIVVTSLFQLHLARRVGVVVALLFAFVLTGWIDMASRVRMQFYRFKKQEYVLAARTLGAGDIRLMFRHIFPNALGTLITGSILMIPGVVYSESNLTYLGIVNLDSSTMSSIGSMLSAGQPLLANYPHIILFPALFISLMMISFNLFGNGMRDAFNPSLRGTEESDSNG